MAPFLKNHNPNAPIVGKAAPIIDQTGELVGVAVTTTREQAEALARAYFEKERNGTGKILSPVYHALNSAPRWKREQEWRQRMEAYGALALLAAFLIAVAAVSGFLGAKQGRANAEALLDAGYSMGKHAR